tara:strand:- start:309 stop:533 length:225 start_codon:yes stop_codon:yes gene_type:complete
MLVDFLKSTPISWEYCNVFKEDAMYEEGGCAAGSLSFKLNPLFFTFPKAKEGGLLLGFLPEKHLPLDVVQYHPV